MIARAIRFHHTGGPEVLVLDEVSVSAPGPGQVRLRLTASGVNFADVYLRSGLYPAELPCIPGREGIGEVTAIGENVADWRIGDRVAFVSVTGSYVESRLMEADRLIALPDEIDDLTAAAMMLRGMTARVLLHDVGHVRSGDTILVHAAAGGVGLMLTQWAASLGATVIGTVSTEEKADVARLHGCRHVLVARAGHIAGAVRRLTDGAMARIVYDAVGRDTLQDSLDSLAPRGHLVSYGQASGPLPPINVQELGTRGSLSITRPMLGHFIAAPAERARICSDLFEAVRTGRVTVRIGATYPLEEAARAHAALESRRTIGSTVLEIAERAGGMKSRSSNMAAFAARDQQRDHPGCA